MHRPWIYGALIKSLRENAVKAKIRGKEKLTPYLFMRTATTRDAGLGFTESRLCPKFGW